MSQRRTARMTVGQALVRYLAVQFSERDGRRQRLIERTWGIFGHGNVAGLGHALAELSDQLQMPFHRPQNEQAAVHAAAAHARHRRRLSTFACTSSIGPGATNMVTGAALATVNRLPVLLLPSDYFANRIPDPVLQQLEHPSQHDVSVNDCFRPVSRFFTRITRPEQLLSALPEAMRVLTDPVETGAVTVALPEDVQAEAWDVPASFLEPRAWPVRRPPPDAEGLRAAVAVLRSARRPLVVAGGGVRYSEAEQALRDFAEAFGVPVTESQAGRGALPWDHPLAAGPLGAAGGSAANLLAAEADVVLAVGTRLGDFVTASRSAFRQPDVRIVALNVTPFDAGKLQGLPLVADARLGLEALTHALRDAGWHGPDQETRRRAAHAKRAWDETVTDLRAVREAPLLAQAEVIGIVNDAFGDDGVVVCAAGSMPGDLLKLWRPTRPDAYHVEYGYSCMGYEIPAGLAIALADPDRPVVVMIGDGSYLMMNSEIVTAVAEGCDLTIVVVDNHGFQSIQGLQRATGGDPFGLELRYRNAPTGAPAGKPVAVDYLRHAEAMGAHALHAPDQDALRAALDRARDTPGVSVVVVPVDPARRVGEYGGWWDVPVAEESDRPGVRDARARYLADRARQRRYKP